jgi:adenosylhomocysteine nucleosidase
MPIPDAAPPDFTHADIGIVYATAIELSSFLGECDRVRKYEGDKLIFRGARRGDIRIAAVESRMGPANASRATQALIDGHTPRWIISAGFSGALVETLRVGDIVVGDSVVDAQGRVLNIDMKMAPDPVHGLAVGRLLTVDAMVRTVAEKRLLAEKHQALAVDMESMAVADVCRAAKLPFLAVRVISDDMSRDLPAEVLAIVGDTGTMRLGAAIGALWKKPGSLKEMWRLREQAGAAAKRLARFLEGVVEQLYAARRLEA